MRSSAVGQNFQIFHFRFSKTDVLRSKNARHNLMYGFLVNSFSNWIFIFHIKRDSRMFQFLYNIQFLYNMAKNHWKHVWKQLYVLLMRLIENFTGVVYYVIVLLYFQPKFWLLEEILKKIKFLLWKSLTWSTQNWSLTLW